MSCSFRRKFSVNKYEGRCNSCLFTEIYISSVIDKGIVFMGKKVKTVTPSRELQAKRKCKYSNKMRKIYKSSRFNYKNAVSVLIFSRDFRCTQERKLYA